MYPYHNKIKQRIKNNELIGYEYMEKYKSISPCLLLHFDTEPKQRLIGYEYMEKYKSISPCLLLHFDTEPKQRPIREHRFEEYEEILKGFKKA